MKTKESKEAKNLQVPGDLLTDKELVKHVKDAEKGPFLTLDEHRKQMKKWIQENSR